MAAYCLLELGGSKGTTPPGSDSKAFTHLGKESLCGKDSTGEVLS